MVGGETMFDFGDLDWDRAREELSEERFQALVAAALVVIDSGVTIGPDDRVSYSWEDDDTPADKIEVWVDFAGMMGGDMVQRGVE